MTHGALFAGIGGFNLAAEWAGIENVWANEIDPYCCKVLEKNFPNLEIIEDDIRKRKFKPVDIISGGFPCQPFSHAGKRKGKDDDRHLWPEMLRVIGEVRPQWVIGENVAGLQSMENGGTLDRILTDLEDIGYQTETFSVPACGVGAWHRRDRIWIVAYNEDSKRSNRTTKAKSRETQFQDRGLCQDVSNTTGEGLQKSGQTRERELQEKEGGRMDNRPTLSGWWDAEPNVGRVANGIPSLLDENLKYYEGSNDTEKITEADKFRREVLREMWWEESASEASLRDENEHGYNLMPSLSHRGTYERWILGKGIEENKTVCNLWRRILSKPFKETQNLQSEMFEQIREIERNEKVGKNRVDRLKSLGNAIVPQVAYQIFKAIKL